MERLLQAQLPEHIPFSHLPCSLSLSCNVIWSNLNFPAFSPADAAAVNHLCSVAHFWFYLLLINSQHLVKKLYLLKISANIRNFKVQSRFESSCSLQWHPNSISSSHFSEWINNCPRQLGVSDVHTETDLCVSKGFLPIRHGTSSLPDLILILYSRWDELYEEIYNASFIHNLGRVQIHFRQKNTGYILVIVRACWSCSHSVWILLTQMELTYLTVREASTMTL